MAERVLTPITQAMEHGALSRRELKALMQRSDGSAFRLANKVAIASQPKHPSRADNSLNGL